MNINQLEKVIEKLRYYKVDKSIRDLPNYIKNLTDKEIKNIISMDFSIFSDENIAVYVFTNHNLLSSDYFYESLNLIFNVLPTVFESLDIPWKNKIKLNDEFNGSLLLNLAANKNAQQSGFLIEDMKLIINKIKDAFDEIPNECVRKSV